MAVWYNRTLRNVLVQLTAITGVTWHSLSAVHDRIEMPEELCADRGCAGYLLRNSGGPYYDVRWDEDRGCLLAAK